MNRALRCAGLVVGLLGANQIDVDPRAVHMAIAAARHDFREVTRGSSQAPPRPYQGLIYSTSIAGCFVIANDSHGMLSCRIAHENSDYRSIPLVAFARRFAEDEGVLRRALPRYRVVSRAA